MSLEDKKKTKIYVKVSVKSIPEDQVGTKEQTNSHTKGGGVSSRKKN